MKFQRPVSELARAYQAQKLVTLPELIDADTANALLRSLHEKPFRQVENRNYPAQSHIRWGERRLTDTDKAYTFCGQSALMELVTAATGQHITTEYRGWANRYQTGEYIGPHKDRDGAAALLICLQTVEGPEYGGSLVIENDQDSPTRVFLNPGDALLFQGTDFVHFTEALQPSAANPEPERVILAPRYFAAT